MKRNLWRMDKPERFLEQIYWTCDEDDNGCWIWPACPDWNSKTARPNLKIGNKRMTTARWVLLAKTGELQEHARHICDVGCCLNPDHLIWGTALENCQDKVERGKSLFGDKNPNSKLSEEQVREILSSTNSYTELSKQYGVTADAIGRVKRGQNWGYLYNPETVVKSKPRTKLKGVPTSSQFQGVSRKRNRWVAEIRIDKKKFYLGSFENEEEAAMAYIKRKELEQGGF